MTEICHFNKSRHLVVLLLLVVQTAFDPAPSLGIDPPKVFKSSASPAFFFAKGRFQVAPLAIFAFRPRPRHQPACQQNKRARFCKTRRYLQSLSLNKEYASV